MIVPVPPVQHWINFLILVQDQRAHGNIRVYKSMFIYVIWSFESSFDTARFHLMVDMSRVVTKVIITKANAKVKGKKSFCESKCECERFCFFLLNRDNAPFMYCTIGCRLSHCALTEPTLITLIYLIIIIYITQQFTCIHLFSINTFKL